MNRLTKLLKKAQTRTLNSDEKVELKQLHATYMKTIKFKEVVDEKPNKPKFKFPRL